MSKLFWTCQFCGSNLDHGEHCDCQKPPKVIAWTEDMSSDSIVVQLSNGEQQTISRDRYSKMYTKLLHANYAIAPTVQQIVDKCREEPYDPTPLKVDQIISRSDRNSHVIVFQNGQELEVSHAELRAYVHENLEHPDTPPTIQDIIQWVQQNRAVNKEPISETLLLGVDMSATNDVAAISVVRVNGENREVVNTFLGHEAAEIYQKLTQTGWGKKP